MIWEDKKNPIYWKWLILTLETPRPNFDDNQIVNAHSETLILLSCPLPQKVDNSKLPISLQYN